jgi:response regulator of citrate/malate metabolism
MPSLSVLLMETNSSLQARLQDRLSELPSIESVLLADSFAGGLQLLRERGHDILILDSSLTNHLGLELLSKTLRPTFFREIIILTNDPKDYYKEYCNKIGIHYVLDMSFEIELLPAVIEEIGQMK